MSNDLISRSEILEEIKMGICAGCDLRHCHECDYRRAMNILKKAPTAYDLDKVVEQLEQQASQYSMRSEELKEKDPVYAIKCWFKAKSYEHAIEIVKGGMNEEGKESKEQQ